MPQLDQDPQYRSGYDHGRILFDGYRTLSTPEEFYSRLQRAIPDVWRTLESPAVQAEPSKAGFIWLRGYLHALLDIQRETLETQQ